MFLVCGDALFDMFLEREDGPGSATYAARAGGSPFNVAIGLARLGVPAAMLTGALVGAQVGLKGIPRRFVDGLADHAALLALVGRVFPR